MFKKNMFSYDKYKFNLSASAIDEISNRTAEVLSQTKLSRQDIMRFRLTVEETMGFWQREIGDGAKCSFSVKRRFNRYIFTVTCSGDKVDPKSAEDPLFGSIQDSGFLQSLGLSVGYSYENGENRISIMPPSGAVMHLMPMVISLLLGIVIALGLNFFLPGESQVISEQIVSPIFDAFIGILRTIAGPLIFLSVISGIYGMGDIAMLGKIGRKLITRFIAMTFLTLIVSFGMLIFFVPIQNGSFAAGEGTISSLLNLIMQFIPTDIVSPFINGNMLQIIFLSICCGLGMLILGEKVSNLARIIDQIFSVVQLLMETVGKLIPIFVFISVLNFILSKNDFDFFSMVTPVVVISGTAVIMVLAYAVRIRFKLKIKILKLFKLMLPTFIVSLTTASSTATLSENIDICENSFGISTQITRFGIPFGQVVYMPLAAVEYFSISMILARSFDVAITPMWIITAILVCGVLAIATPPIAGGGLSVLTVLFTQLNIPLEALTIALGIDMIVDYVTTAANVACMQEELLLTADKMDMLDRHILNRHI